MLKLSLDNISLYFRQLSVCVYWVQGNKEFNRLFFQLNTDSRIRLCARAHHLRYVEGKHQGHRKAISDFLDFVLVRKNNDFAIKI